MNSLPGDAARRLSPEIARTAIGKNFPDVAVESLEYLGSGWHFDVYLTADGWAFRFPRYAWCADLFEPERRVHRLVVGTVPARIKIPQAELMGQPGAAFPYPFAGHRHISGVPADALNLDSAWSVASGIGAALECIHSIPEKQARAAGVAETDPDDEGRREWLNRGLRLATGLRGFGNAISSAVDWISHVSLPLPRYEGPLRFIHQDLSPDHLIVDSDTAELTGILDWTDAALGDSARDFVGLVTWGGWGFAEEVLGSYQVPIDGEFRDRLQFMARFLSVIWLADAHDRGLDVAKHIVWVGNAFSKRTLP